MPQPKVNIIIVNWNGREDTRACLRSLQDLKYPNFGIILVDNGSSDGSAAFFRACYPYLDVIALDSNHGFTGGNNAGMKRALKEHADYVLLLNNDTLIKDVDFLSKMVASCEKDQKIGFACPTIFYDDPPGKVWYAGAWLNMWAGWGHYHTKPANTKEVELTGYATGCCLLARKETICDIGLLNEAYFLSVEDVEWSMRAKQYGWNTAYIPEASIIHKDSQSSRSKGKGVYSPTRIFYEYRNMIWFVREYANLLQKIVVWPFLLAIHFLYKALAYILLGRRGKLRALAQGFKDGLFTPAKQFKQTEH